MQVLSIKLENCYGIRKLEHSFDFSNRSQFVVYAPNGVMKSSFAKTFTDFSQSKEPEDRIYPERETTCEIVDESGAPVNPDSIFVIDPYVPIYESKKISMLLADQTLRDQYLAVYSEIESKKETLFKGLRSSSGIKDGKAIEETFSEDISFDRKEFWTALNRLEDEVNEEKHTHLDQNIYNKIFSSKVIDFLGTDEFRQNLAEYMRIYDQLTLNSNFFKKGVFNHNHAETIAKNLKSNGFFEANHSVFLKGEAKSQEISTVKELTEVIAKEKDDILTDPELRKSFENLDITLNKNAEMRNFRSYLEEHEEIIPELLNPPLFKTRLWISYLVKYKDAYQDLLKTYKEGKTKLEEILALAREQDTAWGTVIELFNSRFTVPFEVTIENQEDVILNRETPSITFRFENGEANPPKALEKEKLLEVLSNGERRALYLLNIIFEIQGRSEENQQTLFVIDDIADSFDYKNKYAIIEYLHDISENPLFKQIILSHNFDFFRSISSRLDLERANKLHSIKTQDGITISQEKYQNNPFNYWRDQIPNNNNNNFLVAIIPFLRNLAEYSGREAEFTSLTSFLHIKSDTTQLKIEDLENHINNILHYPDAVELNDSQKLYLDLLFETADAAVAQDHEEMDLEIKVLLSIAIRLKAELYIIGELNDGDFVNAITKNQTYELIREFEAKFPGKEDQTRFLKSVNLITPENIHLNSFMYEPILDMSNSQLKALYTAAIEL